MHPLRNIYKIISEKGKYVCVCVFKGDYENHQVQWQKSYNFCCLLPKEPPDISTLISDSR